MPLTKSEFRASPPSIQSEALFMELKKSEPNVALLREWLTTNPACLSFQDSNYKTPIHHLVSNSDIDYDLIRDLLTIAPKNITSVYDANFNTPLHIACQLKSKDLKLLELLIKHGADPTLLDGNNKSVFDYSTISSNVAALDILYDGLNEQQRMRNNNVLPTLTELKNQYGRDALAHNMHWALNAMTYVINTNALKAPNNIKGPKSSGGWSKTVKDFMHEEFTTFTTDLRNNLPTYSEITTPCIIKLAELLNTYRGGGDCFYQTSCAYVYLLEHSVPAVEYYKMERASHHFLVIGRRPESDPKKPESWGEDAVICDPWAACCFPASDFHKPREYQPIQVGSPIPLERFNALIAVELHEASKKSSLEAKENACKKRIVQNRENRMAMIKKSNQAINDCLIEFKDRMIQINNPIPAAHELFNALETAFKQYKICMNSHNQPNHNKQIALAFKTACRSAIENIKAKKLDQEPWVGDLVNNVLKAIINALNHVISSLHKIIRWDRSYTLFQRQTYTSKELRTAFNRVSQIHHLIPTEINSLNLDLSSRRLST